MINFLKYTRLYAIISAVVIVSGIAAIARFGVQFSIDFTGGSVLQYRFEKPLSEKSITSTFEKEEIRIVSINKSDEKSFTIKTTPIGKEKEEKIRETLKQNSKGTIEALRVELVGPTLGKETIEKTIIASVVAILGILLYLTFVFKRVTFGLAAVLAMVHDLVVLVGVYAIVTHFFSAEVDILFVTALLTTLSFSVHDTIVVFDRIREYRKHTALSPEVMANKALTETMVRSVNNSLTIMLMLVPLVLFGGDTIRFFATSLLIGTVTGTYSSPFVATPILVFLEKRVG